MGMELEIPTKYIEEVCHMDTRLVIAIKQPGQFEPDIFTFHTDNPHVKESFAAMAAAHAEAQE
jgi:hypothetical protein